MGPLLQKSLRLSDWESLFNIDESLLMSDKLKIIKGLTKISFRDLLNEVATYSCALTPSISWEQCANHLPWRPWYTSILHFLAIHHRL